MKNSVVLPTAMILCPDDIGWHIGDDMRYCGQPSRTGMPRKHVAEDYTMLNELGKAINMKIMCPMCVAEWDKDNILRDEVGTTFQPHTWNRSAEIDYDEAKRSFSEIEKSDFIELAFHGVLHGNYDKNGGQITEMEYFEYKTPDDTKLQTMNEEEILRRLTLFEKIYDSWGFTKPIRSFCAPNGIPKYLTAEDLKPLANALYKKGVRYWTSRWKGTVCHTEFFDGIIYMEKNVKFGVPWNAYDIDGSKIWDFAAEGDEIVGDVMGMHWINFLRFHPQNNLKGLDNWVNYFKRQSEIFGVMLARDIAFSSSQHIYRRFSDLTFEDNKIKIDITNALNKPTDCTTGEFYISIKHNLIPISCKGGNMEFYEGHKEFDTYKIKHDQNNIEITVK